MRVTAPSQRQSPRAKGSPVEAQAMSAHLVP